LICTTAPNVYLVTASNGTQTCQARYFDNGDGTVTDNQTGLMWEKKSAAGTGDVHDVNNVYTWSAAASTDPTGTLYRDFLQQLNGLDFLGGASCFAGHCDWRIPSPGELRSTLQGSYPDCYPTTTCTPPDPPFGPTQLNNYWSSSSATTDYAWYVSFILGSVYINFKTNPGYARAVRSARQ
jgi:hypothetical protein